MSMVYEHFSGGGDDAALQFIQKYRPCMCIDMGDCIAKEPLCVVYHHPHVGGG